MWYLILYVIFAIWVFIDAWQRRNNNIAWSLATLIAGPLALPFYFAKRNLKSGQVREGGTAWNVLKNFAMLWTITVWFSGLSTLIEALQKTTVKNQYEQVGVNIGVGIIVITMAALWFFPMIGALVLGFFLKKSSIIEKGPTGKLAETAVQL